LLTRSLLRSISRARDWSSQNTAQTFMNFSPSSAVNCHSPRQSTSPTFHQQQQKQSHTATNAIVRVHSVQTIHADSLQSKPPTPNQPTRAVSPPVGCHHLHPLSPFIIITQQTRANTFSKLLWIILGRFLM